MSSVRPRPRPLAPLTAVVLAIALVTAGCTDDEPAPASQLIEPVEPLDAPTDSIQQSCAITADQGPVLIAFELPRGYKQVELPGPTSAAVSTPELCRWVGPPPPREGGRSVASTIVALERADGPSAGSLRDRTEELRPQVGTGGDDSVSDPDLRTDVPVFGGTVGDRLTYLCSCDGTSEEVRMAQFAGLQLILTSRPGDAEADAAFEAALASGGVLEELR